MGEEFRKAVEELARLVMGGEIKSKGELNRWKVRIARRYHLSKIPGNSDILKAIPPRGQTGEL